MNDTGFNNNIKLEVAVEIISTKIAEAVNKGYSMKNQELKKLVEERERMYLGDQSVIDKILNVYGSEIRKGQNG